MKFNPKAILKIWRLWEKSQKTAARAAKEEAVAKAEATALIKELLLQASAREAARRKA